MIGEFHVAKKNNYKHMKFNHFTCDYPLNSVNLHSEKNVL